MDLAFMGQHEIQAIPQLIFIDLACRIA